MQEPASGTTRISFGTGMTSVLRSATEEAILYLPLLRVLSIMSKVDDAAGFDASADLVIARVIDVRGIGSASQNASVVFTKTKGPSVIATAA